MLAGRPVVETLEVSNGPAYTAGFDTLDVDFTPAAHGDWSCPTEGVQHVRVDGVAAVLENSPAGGRVCIPDWRGLRLSVMPAFLENPPPSSADQLSIARKLHPIGPDPAHWTADLLR